MKHVTYADKTMLIDDEAADCLLEYARALGSAGMTDTVTLRGIGMDGNEIDATFLLNSGTELVAQTTHSALVGPTNDDAVEYMRKHTRLIVAPPAGRPMEDPADVF